MSFAWPHLLWLLLVPFIWLGWELTHRRRVSTSTHPKILRAEAGARSINLLAPVPGKPVRSKPRLWLAAGLALGLVALARPQWGRLEEPVFDQAREILLAIDLSRSMLTPDVRPSRLERAKLLVQSLLEKLEGERVGLVVFSGTAFLQSPLSSDYEILREFLPHLGPDFLPEGGSNYGALIETSLAAFSGGAAADRFLIILSDGEATDEDWKSRIEPLKKKGIRVIGLGVGTGAGGMIPDGAGGFVKDDRGAVVLSKLGSETLETLATGTNGAYRDASGWVDLAALLKQTVEVGQKGQFVEKNTVRLVERFQWPLALGLWCLLASLCYEFPVRPRPREVKLSGESVSPKSKAGKLASTAAMVVILCLMQIPGPVVAADPAATPSAPPAPPAPPDPPPPSAALAKIVSRLSSAESRSGRDWAELAQETVSWGQRLQSEQQPVAEGPVRDALSAVDLGSVADPKTADWPKLREELESLLKKPEEQKDDQQKQQNQQQQNQEQKNQDQKNQDQQKQDSKSSTQDQKSSDQQQQQKQEPSPPQKENADEKKSSESAFGNMKDKAKPPPPPPPPANDTQKVGGAEKKPVDPAAADPALAQPLQKLEQLKNDDSPAKLFQLMEGERKSPPKKGKDW